MKKSSSAFMVSALKFAGLFGTLFILLASSNLFGQSLYSLRAGWNYCRVTGIEAENYKPQPGYHTGVGFEYLYSNPVGVKAELLFNKKGFYSVKKTQSAMMYQKHFNEVDQLSLLVPILSTLHFKYFSVDVGPYFDFLLSNDQYERIERIVYPREVYSEFEYFNRHKFVNPELGLVVGANMNVFRGFNFSARYLQGFSPLGRDYNWRRMSVVQLAVAMNFGPDFVPNRIRKLRDDSSLSNQYEIITSTHITRANFNRSGDGNQIVIRWRSAESGSLRISNISLEASEGFVESSGNQVRIRDVRFPVECRLRFTVTNTLSGNAHESFLEFKIIETGIWEIIIVNN